MTAERIMELTNKLEKVRQNDSSHHTELQAILDSLTPEERAFWEELAPMILDPEKLAEIWVMGAGGIWSM